MTNFASDNHCRMRAAIYKVFAVVAQMWFKTNKLQQENIN